MLLTPDHFYLSPKSLPPARLILSSPQPTAVHISQSSQRRRLREGRAELGDVTGPYPVLPWCNSIKMISKFINYKMIQSCLENIICNKINKWIINKQNGIAFVNINNLNDCFSLGRLNSALPSLPEWTFHFVAWRIRVILSPGESVHQRRTGYGSVTSPHSALPSRSRRLCEDCEMWTSVVRGGRGY